MRNRQRGIVDNYLVLQKFESLVNKISNDKNMSDDHKIKRYTTINNFIEFMDGAGELKLSDVINTKEKADLFMDRLRGLD